MPSAGTIAFRARFAEPRSFVVVRRFALAVCAVHVVMASQSSYRAWYQVHSVSLESSDRALHRGSMIRSRVVSYGRTYVRARIMLVQGAHAETLAVRVLPSNYEASYDPRVQRAELAVPISDALLARFVPGTATIRAAAIGGPQWLRTPPPVVREIAVTIPGRPRAAAGPPPAS